MNRITEACPRGGAFHVWKTLEGAALDIETSRCCCGLFTLDEFLKLPFAVITERQIGALWAEPRKTQTWVISR